MNIFDLGSDRTSVAFFSTQDIGASYIARGARVAGQPVSSGDPLYHTIAREDDTPPLEFVFDEQGFLYAVSILISGNVQLQPDAFTDLRSLEVIQKLPRVDVREWHEHNSDIIVDVADVVAWWSKDTLWVLRAGAIPAKFFDTGRGISVIFDQSSAFVGLATNSISSERATVERAALAKSVTILN